MIRWVTLYGKLSNVAAVSRKIKKLAKFGFYLGVEELPMDERRRLFKIGTTAGPEHSAIRSTLKNDNLFIDLDDLNDKYVDVYRIEIYGPRRLKVLKDAIGMYRIAQEDNDGHINWSCPVDYKTAKKMFMSGTSRGVKVSLVKVLDEVHT